MSIGSNIKDKRLALDMTQIELADKIGITQSMLCQIERGTKAPSLPLRAEIAQFLGGKVEDLMD